MQPTSIALAVAASIAALSFPLAARPADLFEIQVYDGSIDAPGHGGLELHANYTMRGLREPEWGGQIAPDRVARLTLEPSFGVTEWLELGAYLQGFYAPDGALRFGGWKARVKLVVPERLGLPLRLGVNLELGRVPISVEENGWANEFRPIVGWSGGPFSISVNPIFGYALTGANPFRVELEPALKASWDTGKGFALGIEYYAALGYANALVPLREAEHLALLTYDLVGKPGSGADAWELNVGVGAGLTDATPQHGIVKMIVGREF